MDNRTIDVTSEGGEHLAMAIRIAFANAPGGKATHYRIVKLKDKISYYGEPTSRHYENLVEDPEGDPTLILLWHEGRNAIALPYPLEVDEAIAFVSGWLKNVDRGHQPDHDGDNGHGWRVFTEAWGHVAGEHYAIVGVQPAWAMYGK